MHAFGLPFQPARQYLHRIERHNLTLREDACLDQSGKGSTQARPLPVVQTRHLPGCVDHRPLVRRLLSWRHSGFSQGSASAAKRA